VRLLLRLATRSLLRQVRRNLLSVVSIVLGVFLFILGQGFVTGLTENIVRSQIDTMSGHVVAVPAGYPSSGLRNPVDGVFEVGPALAEWLDARTVAWTGRLIASPRAIHGRDAIRARLVGYDPATEEAVFPRAGWRIDGRGGGVLVSTGAASLLGLRPGDRFVLEARTAAGAINALEVEVGGVLTSNNPAIDVIGILAPRAVVAELLQADARVSHLAVRLEERDGSVSFAEALGAKLGAVAEVRTWQGETAALVDAQQIRQRALEIIVLALMLMAATGIANTVLMAAYERVREIGTLRALGLSRRGVVGMFALEGLLMGAAGAVLGGLLGDSLTRHYAEVGLDMRVLMRGQADHLQNVPFSVMLYVDHSEGVVLGAVVGAVAVALLASIYPAIVASRLHPADAVRAE